MYFKPLFLDTDFNIAIPILVASFGIVAVIVVVTYLLNRKRTQALEQAAQELGLQFTPKMNASMVPFSNFLLFSHGHSGRVTNMMEGAFRGAKVTVFDYMYTVGGGKSSHTVSQTALCFESDRLKLPEFSLSPESIVDKVGNLISKRDINFVDYPGFSKKYVLHGVNEAAVRTLFSPRLLTFFESAPGWFVEGSVNRLLVYHEHKRVKPQNLRAFMEEAQAILALFI